MPLSRHSGPEGPPVDAHFYSDEQELLRQLDTSVRPWIRQAEVGPGQIALLTTKSAERSVLWRIERLGGVELTDDPWEDDKILRASTYRFKGLERLVVAVAELDGAREAALYVDFSRPNVFLSVFCPESARKRLPAELLRAVLSACGRSGARSLAGALAPRALPRMRRCE